MDTGNNTSSLWQVREFSGAWAYRLGASPRLANGDWQWAQPGLADGGWQQPTYPGQAPLAYGQREMWMRVRLGGPQLEKPTLFLKLAGHAEAYLDGKPLAMEELPHHEWEERRSHDRRFLLHFGTQYVGQVLSLHLRSDSPKIGVMSPPYFGEPMGVMGEVIRNSQLLLLVGVVVGVLSLAALSLFLVTRRDAILLYFAIICITMSIWFVAQSGLLGLFFKHPPPSNTIYNLIAPLVFASLNQFIIHAMEGKQFNILRWPRNALLLCSAAQILSILTNNVHFIDRIIQPINIGILIGITLTIILVARSARGGHVDTRIIGIGLALGSAFAAPDVMTLGGFWVRPTHFTMMQFGCIIFLISLGFVPVRRFMETHRQLSKYSELLTAQVGVLERRNKEIQILNEELRRQIEHRSERLIDLLTRSRSGTSVLPVEKLTSGELLGENYRIVRPLGQGGMGVVYEVERLSDGQHLAAKLLSANSERSAMIRFVREARILAQLQHPNLVAITDIDISQDGALFLVMELVQGVTLKDAKQHHRDLELAKTIIRQICLGLQAIHEKGIVHRDLKPANVLLAQTATGAIAKIADFGISMLGKNSEISPTTETSNPIAVIDDNTIDIPIEAQHSDSDIRRSAANNLDSENLTQTGMLLGTPLYMAPELAAGSRKAAPASDVFSLGVIAFELLSGKLPFTVPPIVAVWEKCPPTAPSLKELRPDLPDELAALFDRCLANDPAARPTLAEILAALP